MIDAPPSPGFFALFRYVGGNLSWVSELRAPTAFVYLPIMYGGDTVNPYMSVGFSIATGLSF